MIEKRLDRWNIPPAHNRVYFRQPLPLVQCGKGTPFTRTFRPKNSRADRIFISEEREFVPMFGGGRHVVLSAPVRIPSWSISNSS